MPNIENIRTELQKKGIVLADAAAPTLNALCAHVPSWRLALGDVGVDVFAVEQASLACVARTGEGLWLAMGQPNRCPKVSEEWQSWSIPQSIRDFYAICDGFGPVGHLRDWPLRHGILPANQLAPLSSRMRFGEENILYRPASWWAVARDERGALWCCDANAPILTLARWDPTTHALGPCVSWPEVLSELSARW